MQNVSCDVLIVGQGLAGSILSWRLLERGLQIIVVDECAETNASSVAAGLINPVLGKRLTPVRRFKDWFSNAWTLYSHLEQTTNSTLLYLMPQIRLLTSAEQQEYFSRRKETFLKEGWVTAPPTIEPPPLKRPTPYIQINQSGYCDTRTLLSQINRHLKDRGLILQGKVEPSDLVITSSCVTWGHITAKCVVFCEGFLAAANPYFEDIPLVPTKGDILTLRWDTQTKIDYMINFGKWIVPIGNNLFRAGATYTWDDLTDDLDNNKSDEIYEAMRSYLDGTLTIIDHQCGVRPCIPDQRPVLGPSKKSQRVWIFNGLGSKGIISAPYLAQILCDAIIDQKPIDPSLHCQRFGK